MTVKFLNGFMADSAFFYTVKFTEQPYKHRLFVHVTGTSLTVTVVNKKAVLPQGNRAMPQVFFSVEVRQQHSLQV